MKKLSIILLALMATVANAQNVANEAVQIKNKAVYIDGNKCSSIQGLYIQYYSRLSDEIEFEKTGSPSNLSIDDEARTFKFSAIEPSIFGFDYEGQAEIAKNYIKGGAILRYDSNTLTCTLVTTDKKGVK